MLSLIRGHILSSCLALILIYLKFSDINKNTQIYTRRVSLKTFIFTFFFFKKKSKRALSNYKSHLTVLVSVVCVLFSLNFDSIFGIAYRIYTKFIYKRKYEANNIQAEVRSRDA